MGRTIGESSATFWWLDDSIQRYWPTHDEHGSIPDWRSHLSLCGNLLRDSLRGGDEVTGRPYRSSGSDVSSFFYQLRERSGSGGVALQPQLEIHPACALSSRPVNCRTGQEW